MDLLISWEAFTFEWALSSLFFLTATSRGVSSVFFKSFLFLLIVTKHGTWGKKEILIPLVNICLVFSICLVQ